MDKKVISTLMLFVGVAMLAVFVLVSSWSNEKKPVMDARLVVGTQSEQGSPVVEKPTVIQQTEQNTNQVIDTQDEFVRDEFVRPVVHEPDTVEQAEKQVNQVVEVQDESVNPVVDTPDIFKQTNDTVNQEVSEIVLFYGEGCPHCTTVKEYIEENDIEAKVPFVEKEVYYNAQNANELATKAEDCGLPSNSVGVPFLWDSGTCLIGDKPIISYFKEKTSQY